ncbi:MAG: chitin-binding protein, partial [Bryobacteraceae bacterium]
ASQAQSAFNSALSSHGVSSSSSLDLSNASNRATIFAVIDSAIGNLETAGGMKFNATTTNQL